MFTYRVTMQCADGEIVERDYMVRWDPAKVDSAEVARACAAEATCAAGFVQLANGQHAPKRLHVGLSAELLEPEQELAELAGDAA